MVSTKASLGDNSLWMGENIRISQSRVSATSVSEVARGPGRGRHEGGEGRVVQCWRRVAPARVLASCLAPLP